MFLSGNSLATYNIALLNNVCDQIPDMSVPYMVVYFSMFKQLSHVYIFVQYAWELFT